MPIGKNALKRVTNNGYSSAKSVAPDMENSTVVEKRVAEAKPSAPKTAPKAEPKATPKASASKKPATKAPAKRTTAPKKTTPSPKKSMESEPTLAPVRTAEKVVIKSTKASEARTQGHLCIGDELPYYLL